ncbi:MAG TPA: tetratricopeptide repeat protein, partial [Ignavibacteriaceae bacterium]
YTYGLVVLIAIGGIYFYLSQRAQENEQAGIELSRIMKLYNQGSYLEAIEGRQGSNIIGLKQIVEKYSGTENGETAKIFLANAYSLLGNYEEAQKYFEDYSGSIDYFQAASLAGQAGYEAAKGEYEEAAELYLKASKISEINAENPRYMLYAGINYLNIGEKKQAKVLFTAIKRDFPNTPVITEVDNYIALAD